MRRKELASQRRETLELLDQTDRLTSDLALFRKTTTDSFAEFINLIRDTEERTYNNVDDKFKKNTESGDVTQKLSTLKVE